MVVERKESPNDMEAPKHDNNITTNGGTDGEEGEIEDDVQAKKAAKTAILQRELMKRPMDNGGGGGVYLPPAKRRLLQKQQEEEAASAAREGRDNPAAIIQIQRESWQAQKRVIHGTINRLNAGTIKPLIQELFQKVNLVRLRGVLCKSVLQAAVSSPKYSDVYAALISVVNSKLPEVGELAVKRSILAFRRHYKRREKASCQAVCIFLAHLFHQAVVHELIILQLLSVLLDGDPTDDSVEVAVQLLQVTGQALLEVSPAGVRGCLERLRALLHEGQLNKRVEYKMEQLLKMRKNGFRDFPPISDDLDLVERDDQITFEMTIDDEEIRKDEHLDVFQVDPDFEESEKEWAQIRAEILGEGGSSSDDSSDDSDDSDDDSSAGGQSEASDIPDQELAVVPEQSKELTVVHDLSEADLVHLRRTIYLTIMSSATFEECTHKLARIDIPQGREAELINMLIECCSQERTFLRYYGLISARFCLLDDRWRDAFMKAFEEQYTTIHRLETNKLRNVAKLFAHLLHSDSIPWSVLSTIHLNEDETTSSSRIFIKIVIQEMAEALGIAKLKERFETKEEEPAAWFAGMFPKDNVRNTRYAINFFTSIGLGPLTDDLREFLKNAPKLILAKAKEAALAKKAEDSDSSSESSTSSSSSSSSSDSYTSSRSYTSSSNSRSYTSSSKSDSSSSYSARRRGRGRKRRYSSSSSRSGSYSSSSSRGSSYSSRSGSSASSDSRRSRGRRRGRTRERRKDSRSRSRSPPKEIVKVDTKSSPSDGKKQRQNRKTKDRGKQSPRENNSKRSAVDKKDSRSPSPRPDTKSRSRHSDQKHGHEKSRKRHSSDSPGSNPRRTDRSISSRSGTPEAKSSARSRKERERRSKSSSPDQKKNKEGNSSRPDSPKKKEATHSRRRDNDSDSVSKSSDKEKSNNESKNKKRDREDSRRDSSKRKKRTRSRSSSYSDSDSASDRKSLDSRKRKGRDREKRGTERGRKSPESKPRSRSSSSDGEKRT